MLIVLTFWSKIRICQCFKL